LDAESIPTAFEQGWKALQFAVDPSDSLRVCELRAALTRAIIEVAAEGNLAVPHLVNAALGKLEPMTGRWARAARGLERDRLAG